MLHCTKYHNVRAACPKDQLEFQFPFSPEYVISQVIHGNQSYRNIHFLAGHIVQLLDFSSDG